MTRICGCAVGLGSQIQALAFARAEGGVHQEDGREQELFDIAFLELRGGGGLMRYVPVRLELLPW
jgi:hypothetical protein